MSDPTDDIKRWTARRKAAVVMDIIKGKTTAAELARSHDLTVAEIEQWMDDFVSQGTEALRSHPRDVDEEQQLVPGHVASRMWACGTADTGGRRAAARR